VTVTHHFTLIFFHFSPHELPPSSNMPPCKTAHDLLTVSFNPSNRWKWGKWLSLVVECSILVDVSILASFCVWTKSLVCNDAPQGFYYSEMLQSQKIFSSLSAVWTIEPSRPDDHLSLFHPSERRAIPSGLQTNQASSVRTTCFSVRTLHCVEKVLSSLHPSGRFSSTSGRLSVLDQFHISFQVPRKGRSINRPDDVVSRPDGRLLKARIAIQISPSGRLTAVVRTSVHQRKKLPIRLQLSGRLPIMVRTRALQIWKLRVEE
jgi:hypothetical protein